MVSRSRFFRASLWAALAPVALLVAAAIFVMLFPRFHRLGDTFLVGSGLALLGVPFAYTAVVVATYGIGRALYDLRLLSLLKLIAVYSVLAVALAWLMTWWLATGETVDIMRSFAVFVVAGLIAASSTAFIWWRVVCRVAPDALVDDDVPRRVRRRQRKGFFRRLANKW